MLTKRIIPCLDVKDGRTVKGVNFENLRDAGDPVELGRIYAEQGADELVFLDIAATLENRGTLLEMVKRVAETLNIPFTVGGGISSVADVSALLNAGAEKVSINSAAVRRPELVNELSKEFGSQCVVVAIDTRNVNGTNIVHTHGGTKPTELITEEWAKEVEQRGVGGLFFTSMDHEGVKTGFANEVTSSISSNLNIPLIASGVAGAMQTFYDALTIRKAERGLAAGIFHFKEIGIPELKNYLKDKGLSIRI